MKRILILLSVMGTISITQLADANGLEANTKYSAIEFSEQNEWEDLGDVSVRFEENGTIRSGYASLYVRVIAGKSFYKIKWRAYEYAVSKNPQYNPNGTKWYQKYTHKAGYCYLNL